jgi:hypothetical protein
LDVGTEFTNKQFQDYLKSQNVIHFSTFSNTKANICERAIRTLMEKLARVFEHNKNHKFLKILPMLTKSYNNTPHRTLGGSRPNDVNEENQHEIFRVIYSELLQPQGKVKPKHSVGDKVRVSLVKNIFAKGYATSWSTEVFEITKVRLTHPITYFIKDQNGEEIKGKYRFDDQNSKANETVF